MDLFAGTEWETTIAATTSPSLLTLSLDDLACLNYNVPSLSSMEAS